MKSIIPFAVFIVGISAGVLTQAENINVVPDDRIVAGQIVQAINNVAEAIRDAGLDPIIVTNEAREYALPVPEIFNAAGTVEDLVSFGLSDIRVNRMNFNGVTLRLTFNVEMPRIHLSIGQSVGVATVFGNRINAEVSGGVDINSIRVTGEVRFRLSVISGISVRSLTANFSLQSIDSYLRIVFLGHDVSNYVNMFIGNTIPSTLIEFRSEIDELLEIILYEYIEAVIGRVGINNKELGVTREGR